MTTGGARARCYTLVDYAHHLHLQGLCPPPALGAEDAPPPNPQGPVRTFTESEVEMLIAAAACGVSLRWWAFVTTLADTGRRPGEVLNLEWAWSRLEDEPAHFVLPTTKTRRPQYMPLTTRLATEVYTPENIATLKRGGGGASRRFSEAPLSIPFPMCYTSVTGSGCASGDRLGLSHRGGLHRFRHSKATSLLAAGTPVHAVARLLDIAASRRRCAPTTPHPRSPSSTTSTTQAGTMPDFEHPSLELRARASAHNREETTCGMRTRHTGDSEHWLRISKLHSDLFELLPDGMAIEELLRRAPSYSRTNAGAKVFSQHCVRRYVRRGCPRRARQPDTQS